MFQYRIHTIDSAPEKAKPALHGLKQNFGLVPNLAATMAESPALLNTFMTAFGNFHGSSFNAAERQVLLLTNAVTNASEWAVAFHSTLALKEGVGAEDVRAIRERSLPAAPRLAALSALTRALIEKRGAVDASDLARFAEAGFGQAAVFEVITGIAVSTMANFAGNVARPPLEEPFRAQAWSS
jgi:alkylhydroperoxidase family enzyme